MFIYLFVIVRLFAFELQGQTAGVGAVGHLILPYNLSRIFSNHEAVLQEFQKFSSLTYFGNNESDLANAYAAYAPVFQKTMERFDFLTSWGSNALNELALYLGMPYSFPSNSTLSTRLRRQAVTAALGSIFSLRLGLFEELQILSLMGESKHQQQEIGGLVTVAHEHE